MTVLFCDLVGSTALSSRLDPEEMRQLLRLYQDACSDAIGPFAGQIAQTMGDGLLVYFGYPQAHEDDAERAVRAALAMVSAVALVDRAVRGRGGSCAVRIGISTGLVVVGAVARSDTRANMAVVGETPNIAARLQQLAEPNEILVGSTTHRLVAGRFRFDAPDLREIKGIARLIAVYRVRAERSSERRTRSASAADPLSARPLVGRAKDLSRLLQGWAKAVAGKVQVVAVSGPPGIGKSRLVRSLIESLDPAGFTLLRYSCSPYFQNTPFYPIVSRIEREARIRPDDRTSGKLRKLKRWMSATSEVADGDLALVARLLGILDPGHPDFAKSSADRLLEDTRTVLIGRLLALARRSPALVIVEDAHWIDPSSLRLMRQAVSSMQRAGGQRVFVVIAHRPEFSLPWRDVSDMTELVLERLDLDECRSMVCNMAPESNALPRRIAEQIALRSDGIPFFVEELTKAVLESGDARTPTSVPASLQDSLTARLDRVGPSKLVAQLGACIGRSFSFPLLATIAPVDESRLREGLERLVAADLILREDESPNGTFTFRHALVQNAAYESMLRSERRRVHAAIARHLETAAQSEHGAPEVLAQHLTAAGDHGAALVQWLRAGLLAQRRSAHVEAISHLRAGLQSLGDLPPSAATQAREIELQCALARSHMAGEGWPGGRVHEAYSRARSLCRATRDARKECEVLWGLWAHHVVRGELAKARTQAEEYVHLAESENHQAALLMADSAALISYFCLGDLDLAERHAARIHATYRFEEHSRLVDVYNHDPLAIACMYESSWLWIQGFPDRAERAGLQAVEHARRLGHPFQLCYALITGAGAFVWRREHARLLACIEEGVRLAEERRIPVFRIYGPLWGIPAFVEREPSPSTLARLRGCIDAMRASHSSMHLPFYLMQLASGHDRLGQAPEARTLVDEALALMEVTGERWVEPELLRMRMQLLRSRELTPQAAERGLRAAFECASKLGARGFELRIACDFAELLHGQARVEEARAMLDSALSAFSEGFQTADLRRAVDLRQRLYELARAN